MTREKVLYKVRYKDVPNREVFAFLYKRGVIHAALLYWQDEKAIWSDFFGSTGSPQFGGGQRVYINVRVPENSNVIYVPRELMGKVIGRGGKNIKEISKRAGRRIKAVPVKIGVRVKCPKCGSEYITFDNYFLCKCGRYVENEFWEKEVEVVIE